MSDDLPFVYAVEIVGLLASPEHRYDGRPGSTVPEQSADRRERLEVRAGFGIVGDRYAGSRRTGTPRSRCWERSRWSPSPPSSGPGRWTRC
ncbi:hypothetical protein [Blastococcus brunescens]|uniref:Uncharacterized protein n=1 Tax=Blastococcus brunescens TaxID=1564165 RepID=A0ABZ1B919_9ACTN|nr:hypothetical protein [Blastococcus sp. BMG 8361]WRL67318.1 hypothetical protein U6N30_28235 [Blastococcus sp. BMG 8361]